MRVLRRRLPIHPHTRVDIINLQLAFRRHVDIVMGDLLEEHPHSVCDHRCSTANEFLLVPANLQATIRWRHCFDPGIEENWAHDYIGSAVHDVHHDRGVLQAACIDIPWLSGSLVNVRDLTSGCGTEEGGRALLVHGDAGGDIG